MKKLAVLLLVVVLFASSVSAAHWIGPLKTQYSWDKKEWGFCPSQGQCFVSASADAKEEYNGDPSKYFTDPPGPQCIDDGQYILDEYCDDGEWRSRTMLVALSLLDFASRKSNDYVLYCDNYEDALNQYEYLVGPSNDKKLVKDLLRDYRCAQHNTATKTSCVNNICILKYSGGTAFGTSLNTNINDPTYSFLYALDHSINACNNVASTATNFQRCTGWQNTGRAFYNPEIKSFIYLSTDDALPATSYPNAFNAFIKPEFAAINNYVMDKVHSDSVSSQNFSFFEDTGLYNHIYYSQQGNARIFSFYEPEKTEFRLDYLGAKYTNYNLGTDPCTNIFEQYGIGNKGRGVYCQNQTGNSFIVVGKRSSNSASPIVDAWQALASKLRPK